MHANFIFKGDLPVTELGDFFEDFLQTCANTKHSTLEDQAVKQSR